MKIDIEPTKRPSVLIRHMIEAGRALDREVYYAHHGQWHRPTGAVCWVCAAGVVIAYFSDVKPTEFATPNEWSTVGSRLHWRIPEEPWAGNLCRAIEGVRQGYYMGVLLYLGVGSAYKPSLRNSLSKITKPKHGEFDGWEEFDLFLVEMADIADQFEEIGL